MYMKVMKMYACAGSIRQLINSALRFSRGSGWASNRYSANLQQNSGVEPIMLLRSMTGFPPGSLCSNRFLIAGPSLFYLDLNLCTATQR